MKATQVFGANAMTSEERRRRQFDGVADVDAAARVWTAASELRERLAALSEAAELPAKPATSAGFYGEDELQGILAMHEQVLDVVDSEPAVTEASVFDLHEIVKGMVEGDGDGGSTFPGFCCHSGARVRYAYLGTSVQGGRCAGAEE